MWCVAPLSIIQQGFALAAYRATVRSSLTSSMEAVVGTSMWGLAALLLELLSSFLLGESSRFFFSQSGCMWPFLLQCWWVRLECAFFFFLLSDLVGRQHAW